jgi:hypothetical protein
MVRFTVTFKRGPQNVAEIQGEKFLREEDFTMKDSVRTIPEIEQYLERLTGYRVHINMIEYPGQE